MPTNKFLSYDTSSWRRIQLPEMLVEGAFIERPRVAQHSYGHIGAWDDEVFDVKPPWGWGEVNYIGMHR